MSDDVHQSESYVVHIRVHDGRNRPVKDARVFAELLDIEAATLELQRELEVYRGGVDSSGICALTIVPELVQHIERGDGTAQLLVVAASRGQGLVGSDTIPIQVHSSPPQKPVPVRLYRPAAGGARPSLPSDSQEAVEVTFTTEVLDTILGMTGGGPTAGSSTTTGVFDDRFFEDRLRRLIGANVRAGDVAGLRREIDRVVVEEKVEGETQFVFRGAGRPRAPKTTAGTAYKTTGLGSGSMRPGYAASSYASANSNGAASYSTTNNGTVISAFGGDNLAGEQAILYRRASAELDYARQALASLQPKDPENSEQFESFRSLVDAGLVDLVTAFGSELRPPVARVEGTFSDLLGDPGTPDTPGTEGFIQELGHLGAYIDEPDDNDDVGILDGDTYLTLADEQERTRYEELETYVQGLRDQWDKFSPKFLDQLASSTLNVRSTRLGRRIGYVADGVRELDLALATAPGDPGEREFEPIEPISNTTLNEYITWLNDFVADGQSQVRDGSTVSFVAIAREAGRLATIANDALNPDPERHTQVEVLNRRLVRRALEELRDNLQDIAAVGSGGAQG